MSQRIHRIRIVIDRYVEFEGKVPFEFDYVPVGDNDPFIELVLAKAHDYCESLQLAGGDPPEDIT